MAVQTSEGLHRARTKDRGLHKHLIRIRSVPRGELVPGSLGPLAASARGSLIALAAAGSRAGDKGALSEGPAGAGPLGSSR